MRRRVKKRLNIVGIIFLWLIFLGYINIWPPAEIVSFLIFYFLLFLSLFFTLQLFLAMPKSILWATTILGYLLLRQNHLDNMINNILLLGIFLTLEIYFKKK